MREIPVCRLAESLAGVGIGTSAENFAGLAAVEIASVLKASRHFITPMRQLNQFGADGKLATAVPLRPRALRITVRGPDHFSGGRSLAAANTETFAVSSASSKAKTRRWAGLVVVMQVQAANAFAAMP